MAAIVTLAMLSLLSQSPANKASSKPAAKAAAKPPGPVSSSERVAILDRERRELTALVTRLNEKGKSDESDLVRALIEPQIARGMILFRPLPEYSPQFRDPGLPAEAAKVRETAAKALFDLALRAGTKPNRRFALADECLRGVLLRDPDHAEARRLLGYVKHKKGGWATPHAASLLDRGYVLHPKFGWVLSSWVANLDAGKLPLVVDARGKASQWGPAERADAQHSDWSNPWQIDTAPHFTIDADVPLSEAVAFASRLEVFHDLFLSMFADVIGENNLALARRFDHPEQKSSASKKKFLVAYFATKAEYVNTLRKNFGMNEDESLGYYMPASEASRANTKPRSYFYKDESNPIAAHATLYHEASHQILFESAGSTKLEKNTSNYWVWEGLGTYFEMVTPQEDGSLLLGELVGPRIAQAKQQAEREETYIPLDKFVAMGESEFRTKETIRQNYAQAMALVAFMLHGEGGKYREPFLDFVGAAYRGNGIKPSSLSERLGVPYAELDKQFRSYLK